MARLAHSAMSFDEDSLLPPPPVYCSGERYRQCSPESCPGLTAQCTDRCVVVTCSDPHDGDTQDVCGDIICDDQSCTDPTDCHGIYDFVSLPLPNPSLRSPFAPLGLNPTPRTLKNLPPGRRSLTSSPLAFRSSLATVLRQLSRLPPRPQVPHPGRP